MAYDTFSKLPAPKVPSNSRNGTCKVYYIQGEGKVNKKDKPRRSQHLKSL